MKLILFHLHIVKNVSLNTSFDKICHILFDIHNKLIIYFLCIYVTIKMSTLINVYTDQPTTTQTTVNVCIKS